ncbi:tyrosine-type recombinase/integrase [Streptomyces guryensis]|uniref:Tyrosine-type recombinase/integrase n=1 Tax=Streptomyces guryensis TaxID=2886947 RepID=A0A9Q3Z5F9_9ACTN|nr:tyrosine-type recombinase/integrase [Streptomyces guryensis]MCD9875666.1 tyrosine-type recombinase/integrase [Streptomyces guryensis]
MPAAVHYAAADTVPRGSPPSSGHRAPWFVELCEEIGLPPVRLLHGLRHGAATPAHAAGADLKDIQEMLSHSSITITADTCTSLLPEADLAIAEAAARLGSIGDRKRTPTSFCNRSGSPR